MNWRLLLYSWIGAYKKFAEWSTEIITDKTEFPDTAKYTLKAYCLDPGVNEGLEP